MSLDLSTIRSHFPSLNRPDIFFDNPGGTQIALQSLERMQNYLLECNANHGGAFQTSRASDEILDEAHAAMADFLNASRPEEIIFGPNMTTLTFSLSRALGRLLNPGDEIVVTRLDHDANISPWMLLAEDHGCKLTWVDFDVEDGTLIMEDYEKALANKPKIVAFGYASNALGTINPVRKLTKLAKDAGALVFIDAVQYAPHGPIDVQAIGCDFLACSAYKFFGPHIGILYGKYELLDELKAYKVRPAPKYPPGKWMTGTQNHEGIAGTLGALEYFAWLGQQYGFKNEVLEEEGFSGRRLILNKAMLAIRDYEFEVSRTMIETLAAIPGLRLYGLNDMRRLDERVPTFAFTLENKSPHQIAEALGEAGIYVWDGNYYALAVTERLGVEANGGMVRVGPVHYNTLDEINRLGTVLEKIVS